ncbi:MAG: hypoxanthine phosphoribosyltransferase [Eubacteriales bacterium]|nr:hypoxanthine phosphoribosyltransferase [Eubacteriales bacterium]
MSRNYDILFSAAEIQTRVQELGAQISRDYQGKDLVLVAMLKGSIYFMADLTRAIDLPIAFDLIGISSLGRASQDAGIVRVTKDLDLEIEGREVLVVEEIVRSGLTTNYMLQYLEKRRPKSLRLISLLANPEQQLIDLPLDYLGFEIDYSRVVGYGMDFREQDRHLPFIASLDKERYKGQ